MITLSLLLALILVTLLLILLVPFHLTVNGGYEKGMRGAFLASWLWGFFRVSYRFREKKVSVFLASLEIYDRTVSRKERTAEKPHRERKKRRRRFPADIAELLSIARRLLRSLRPGGRIDTTFGLGDPSETGVLFGILKGIFAYLPLPVTVIPDFKRFVFMFEGELSVRVWLAQLLGIFISVALSPRGRALLKSF